MTFMPMTFVPMTFVLVGGCAAHHSSSRRGASRRSRNDQIGQHTYPHGVFPQLGPHRMGHTRGPSRRSSGIATVGDVWSRPVPLIGDATSAAQRSSDPRAWAFSTEQREALHEVIGARR